VSDLFEIKSVNAEIIVKSKGKEKTFKFSDPRFLDKIMLRKEHKILMDKRETMDFEDYMIAMYEINKKMVKQYLPDITDAALDELGEFSFQALLNKISDLTQNSFGAIVEKVEKK
jgi:hypothetical protein